MPQRTATSGDMIGPPVGRYIRYWYTYRAAVAVLMAVVISILVFGLYSQQVTCDTGQGNCVVNIAVHPEDRLFISNATPNPDVVVVGIDDATFAGNKIQTFPIPRSYYALALRNLEAAGAAVVAFDVSFTDARDQSTDADFAATLKDSKIPVLLSYPSEASPAGLDQAPLREFWCSDPTGVCVHPYPNVVLASTDVVTDSDGVVRRLPMFVQPQCYRAGSCSMPALNPMG